MNHRPTYALILALHLSLILGTSCSSTSTDQSQRNFLLRPEVQQRYAELYKAESGNLQKVTAYWAALKDDDKLPGLSKEDHGQFSIYYLSPEIQSDWLRSKILDKEMISDVGNCKGSSYLAYVSPNV